MKPLESNLSTSHASMKGESGKLFLFVDFFAGTLTSPTLNFLEDYSRLK